jgi:hypothetical protein
VIGEVGTNRAVSAANLGAVVKLALRCKVESPSALSSSGRSRTAVGRGRRAGIRGLEILDPARSLLSARYPSPGSRLGDPADGHGKLATANRLAYTLARQDPGRLKAESTADDYRRKGGAPSSSHRSRASIRQCRTCSIRGAASGVTRTERRSRRRRNKVLDVSSSYGVPSPAAPSRRRSSSVQREIFHRRRLDEADAVESIARLVRWN